MIEICKVKNIKEEDMKRTLKTFIALTLVASLCLTLASCVVHEHIGEWTTVKEPTCTEGGEQKRICKDCGETQTQAIPAKGHTAGVAATCTTT